MTEPAKYLYCIVRCSEERSFEGVIPIGGVQSPVYTIPQDGLAAVVSDSPATSYETTRVNMMAHERVLEGMMQEFTLLPVRFGTVAESALDIQKLLKTRSQEFHRLLADMDGKTELGLKALWRDEKAVFEELIAENPNIKRLRDSLRGKSPETVHFEGVPLGRMVKEALDRKRAAEAASVLAPLRPMAHQTVENATVADRIVVNAAFLVTKDREEAFDGAVSRLEEELRHRVLFRYVGPVPPYNFVNIVVNWQQL